MPPQMGERSFDRPPGQSSHDYLAPLAQPAGGPGVATMPGTPRNASAATADPRRSGFSEIAELLHALWRRRNLILLTTLLFLMGGVLALILLEPRYQSIAQILIDPRPKNIVDGTVVPTGLGSSSLGADTLLLESQVEIIGSQAVLESVVRDFKLGEDREFTRDRGPGVRRYLRNLIGPLFPDYQPEADVPVPPEMLAIQSLRERNFWVERVGNTYVIEVGVWSKDATKAADLANAIAQAYLDDQVRSTTMATRETTESLEARIGELKKRVELAEQAVEKYRAEKGLVSTPDGLVSEQQLQELNQRLVLARVRTAAADARYKQLQAAAAGKVDVDSTTEALNSRTIQDQRAVLARATQREAVLRQQLGARHPDLIAAIASRKDAARALRAELSRIAENARSEFQLARANEKALQTSLNDLEAKQVRDNEARVRLRELEREADTARTIFDSFDIRAKQSSEQERLRAETTRIISRAEVAPRPAFPRAPIILGASGAAGLLAGLMLAWLVHIIANARLARASGSTTSTRQEATA